MNSTEKQNFIFLVGNQRSGTTLITRLLDGHKDVLSLYGESHFFSKIEKIKNFSDIEQKFLHLMGRPYDYQVNWKQDFTTSIDRNKNWHQTEFWETIQKKSPDIKGEEEILKKAIEKGDEREIFSKIVEIYQKNFWPHEQTPKYVLEKTPGNEFYLEKIFTLFPEAKILHIVRDPFDVIESILKRKDDKQREKKIMGYIFHWKESFREGIKWKQKKLNNYYFFKHENLVNNTEEEIKRICNFLDIEFDNILLRPTDHAGKELFKSHTHQKREVQDGAVDKKLLEKDALKELGEEYMKIIGAFVAPEYKVFGWDKYKNYTSGGLAKILFQKYPNKNFKNSIKNTIKYFLSKINCQKAKSIIKN